MEVMTEKETFADRLKWWLEKKGMTQYRLARTSGLKDSYVSQLVSGKVDNPRSDTVAAITKGLGITVGEFWGETMPRHSPEAALSEITDSLKAYIPVYAEVSAGEGLEPIDYVATTRTKPPPESIRAYRVKGLCLDPEIKDGDTLIVDTALIPQPDDLVVCIIEGQASVKYYRTNEAGEKWLENHVGRYMPEECHIHGVVTEFNRKRR